MSGCRVQGCTGDVRGQMVGCAPHFSLLSEPLRLEIVASWDALQAAKGFERPIVAELERWYLLLARADGEWAAIRARLRRRLLRRPPVQRQDGRVWARELDKLPPQLPPEPES